MKSDAELKADVTFELEWDPAVNATNVGVAVKDGVVTLSGHLDSYAEKYDIERAVARVGGVRAIAIELDVRPESGQGHSDADIALAAEAAFKWHAHVSAERILLKVEKGWVTLTGAVHSEEQRSAAEAAVRALDGVAGVTNHIVVG